MPLPSSVPAPLASATDAARPTVVARSATTHRRTDRPVAAERTSPPPHRPALVGTAELLTALSHALDLTEGAPPGHTLRSCLIGMRLAEEIGLDIEARAALYYALLLKDAGCSSNAARMTQLFGADDRVVKPKMKIVDANDRIGLALETWRNVAIGRGLLPKVKHMLGIARGDNITQQLIVTRCERGADIAARLGFPEPTREAIRYLDEHWNGKGQPYGLAADAIPIGARIANIAQTVDVYAVAHGPAAALQVVRERAGTWFDPRLAKKITAWRHDPSWWTRTLHDGIDTHVAAIQPAPGRIMLDPLGVENVARAFADVVDAKSPYTFQHSVHVAAWVRGMARTAGADAATLDTLFIAGLLHDVGKLGVSNMILDKPGKLTDEEFAAVQAHPRHTWEILSRIAAFEGIARTAALHHEKLDGSGYPWKLGSADMDRWTRFLVVADIYEALTADRPYRAGIPRDEVLRMLERDRGTKLDGEALDALAATETVETT
jgi:HD-GYP domain-containing protein (c-di-GMP phosphodiesterase class II)